MNRLAHTMPSITPPRFAWRILAALLVLSAIPFAAGLARLFGLASHAPITPDNARFVAAPIPVIIHIVGASLFCVLGAFQFAPGFGRGRLAWHRLAGWVVVVAGIAAALSGLWMTQFYPLPPQLQGNLLYSFRLLIGVAMVASLGLGWAAIRRREYSTHWIWLLRAYAIGQGAGTQALVMLPWAVVYGEPTGLIRDILMIAAWMINMAVAEWIIHRQTGHGVARYRRARSIS